MRRAYAETKEARAKRLLRLKLYNASPGGKAAHRRYRSSPKGMAADRRTKERYMKKHGERISREKRTATIRKKLAAIGVKLCKKCLNALK